MAKQEQVCRDDGRCQYAIDSGAEGMGHCPKGKCVMPAKQEQGEPLEYWNAVEGWVKLDEVREHFDSVSCATIYKNGGEGRVPLSLAQPKQEQGESEPDQFINAMKFDLVVQQHLDALRQAGRATMETVKDKLAETLYKEYGGK